MHRDNISGTALQAANPPPQVPVEPVLSVPVARFHMAVTPGVDAFSWRLITAKGAHLARGARMLSDLRSAERDVRALQSETRDGRARLGSAEIPELGGWVWYVHAAGALLALDVAGQERRATSLTRGERFLERASDFSISGVVHVEDEVADARVAEPYITQLLDQGAAEASPAGLDSTASAS